MAKSEASRSGKRERMPDSEDPAGVVSGSARESHFEQIEYLLQQSTQGLHLLFNRADIGRVLSVPTNDQEFFTLENMARVQGLLSAFIEAPDLLEKQKYIKSLSQQDYEVVLRAYFHLVENTILGRHEFKH